jgi:hypothetical protein
MNSHFYRENSARGRRDFDLQGRILKISGKPGFTTFKLDVDLADIAPHFERVTCYNHGALRRSAIYIGVVAVVASLFRSQIVVPFEWIVLAAFGVALPGIITFVRFLRPLEIEQFRSQAGVVVFDVVRVKRQAEEFESYVELLRTAVLNAQTKTEPNQAPEPTPTSVTPPVGQEARQP